MGSALLVSPPLLLPPSNTLLRKLFGARASSAAPAPPAAARRSRVPPNAPRSPPDPRRSLGSALKPLERREALAMIGGVAEQGFGDVRALEPEVQVELPGEADAAVDLDGAARGSAVDVRERGLGDRGGARALARGAVGGVCRVPHERARGLDVGHHLGQEMLDRLKGADLPPELLADPRVLERHLERPCRAPEAVGRDAETGEIGEPLEKRPGGALAPEDRVPCDVCAPQRHGAEAARHVEACVRRDAHAGLAALDGAERDAAAAVRRARAGDDEEEVGGGRVEHHRHRPAEGHPAALARRAHCDVVRRRRARVLRHGQRRERLAAYEPRQPSLAKRRRAAVEERRDRELRRKERSRRGDASDLLAERGQLERAEAEAARVLRDEYAHPAELGHLAVEPARHAVLAGRTVAHEERRTLACEELACAPLERLLIGGEPEVDHAGRGSRGSPRPRSAMMFFCTWAVPPPMMSPSANMKSSGQSPPSIAASSRRWSQPRGPRISRAARPIWWLSSQVVSLFTDAAMPAGRPWSVSVSCR